MGEMEESAEGSDASSIKTKKEKRSKWVKSFETVFKSPVEYASVLEINGMNMNGFKTMFPLHEQYALFTDSARLNDGNNQGSTGGNTFNLSLNVNASSHGSDSEDVVGEKERKTVGYRHKWFGANIGDTFTVIGYWDGEHFVNDGCELNTVSKRSYTQMIKDHERYMVGSNIMYCRTIVLSRNHHKRNQLAV